VKSFRDLPKVDEAKTKGTAVHLKKRKIRPMDFET